MQPDILLVVTDTARADAFSPWKGTGTDTVLEQLARQGTVYERALTAAPWTLPSHASIFAGVLPTEHGIHNDSIEWVDNKPRAPGPAVRAYGGPWLTETLQERGYRTFAASCNQWITEWGGFDRGFHEFHNLTDRERLPAGRISKWKRRADRLLGRLDRGGKSAFQRFSRWYGDAGPAPLFSFVNLMELHSPYDPPRGYYPYPFWRRRETYRLSGGSKTFRPFLMYNFAVQQPPQGYVSTIRTLYRAAARYEDTLMGWFVKAIRDRGRPTVVIMVSDHGENLGEHGMFGHNSSLAETLLHVPLLVWGHRVDMGGGARVTGTVSLTALADWIRSIADGQERTIAPADAVVSEFESTAKWLPPTLKELIDTGKAKRVPTLALHPGVAVRRGSMKYVTSADGQEAVYDVDADPSEEHDVLATTPEAAVPFQEDRERWLKRRAAQPTYGAGYVAEDEIAAHLRELGYID
jgi:arylsulfatase A-like enzyme